jgi:hypothetical protein
VPEEEAVCVTSVGVHVERVEEERTFIVLLLLISTAAFKIQPISNRPLMSPIINLLASSFCAVA